MPARAMMKHGLRLNLIKHLQFARGCMVILHHSGLLGYFKNLFRLLLAVLAGEVENRLFAMLNRISNVFFSQTTGFHQE